jgi:hypothetical protein
LRLIQTASTKHSTAVSELTSNHESALAAAREEAVASLHAAHSADLHQIRTDSEATVNQLREAHAAEVESLSIAKEAIAVSEARKREAEVSGLQAELDASRDVSSAIPNSAFSLILTLVPYSQDLDKAKTAAQQLEASLASVNDQLVATQEALKKAEETAASSAAAVQSADNSELEAKISEAQQDLEDARHALQQTQEDAQAQIDSMSKMHSLELSSITEDHVNSSQLKASEYQQTLSELQSKLTAIDEDRETLRSELADAKQAARRQSVQQPTGTVTDVDVSALHTAHQAKLREVENDYERKIQELEEVSPVILKACS